MPKGYIIPMYRNLYIKAEKNRRIVRNFHLELQGFRASADCGIWAGSSRSDITPTMQTRMDKTMEHEMETKGDVGVLWRYMGEWEKQIETTVDLPLVRKE